MNELWIPILAVLGTTVVVSLLVWFRFRTRSEMQQTMRSAIEQGQQLSPEIIDRLGKPKASKDRDLRLSFIWFAIAISLAAFGFAIPDDEALRIFLGMAAFPLSIGVAYYLMWRFTDTDR
ncbi:MAG: DUF6249 domain-containing protein [Pseudomonadota bacterium]